MKTLTKEHAIDLAAVRRRLVTMRSELLQRHRHTLDEENELLASRDQPEVPDVAANRTAAALLDRLSDGEMLQLQRIAVALDRIDDGSYGTCVVCGGPIAKARLEVMPEADRCERCHNSH